MSLKPSYLIAGNWKMNGDPKLVDEFSQALSGRALKQDGASFEALLCPPAALVAQMAEADFVSVGGQDCHSAQSGAHTGDCSPSLLRALGASYCIVGHSERRTDHAESDATVAAKAGAAIQAGLVPIICIGEHLAQREAGEAEAVALGQLKNSIPEDATATGIVIAYEPVWAIGTGVVATVDDVDQMHTVLRAALVERFGAPGQSTKLLYGGSMKPSNAGDLLALDNVNGGLIGGASLKVDDFAAIIDIVC